MPWLRRYFFCGLPSVREYKAALFVRPPFVCRCGAAYILRRCLCTMPFVHWKVSVVCGVMFSPRLRRVIVCAISFVRGVVCFDCGAASFVCGCRLCVVSFSAALFLRDVVCHSCDALLFVRCRLPAILFTRFRLFVTATRYCLRDVVCRSCGALLFARCRLSLTATRRYLRSPVCLRARCGVVCSLSFFRNRGASLCRKRWRCRAPL